jgi:NADP-dependent 3-hydroxy acid dehydrogenase YdfG
VSKRISSGGIVSKNWFIAGASAGFGFEFVRAVAGRRDRVVATSRRVAGLEALVSEFGGAVVPVELDKIGRSTDFPSHGAEVAS